MKNLLSLFAAIGCTLAFASCGNDKPNTATHSADTTTAAPAATSTTATYTPPAGVDASVSVGIKGIVDAYLGVKNALVKDNTQDAATAGASVVTAVEKVDMKPMNDAQMKVWHEVMDDIKEHGQHISDNSGKIAHQREHLEMLSKDVETLAKTFGGGQKLYKEYCPMAFDNKGAAWLSESEEIRNPYFGSEMLECGEVKEELK
jgi:hypothetical protein